MNLLLEKETKHVDEKDFKDLLYTAGMPDPDLIIRTSGEHRISNFLLFQMAYSELYFTQVLWPDFNKDQYLIALEDFSSRKRRFGGVDDEQASG